MTNLERFFALRKRLFEMIGGYFATGEGHCKSYEGQLYLVSDYGNYFDDEEANWKLPQSVTVHLDVYVVGPGRHYDFTGKTLAEALDKFEEALNEWGEYDV